VVDVVDVVVVDVDVVDVVVGGSVEVVVVDVGEVDAVVVDVVDVVVVGGNVAVVAVALVDVVVGVQSVSLVSVKTLTPPGTKLTWIRSPDVTAASKPASVEATPSTLNWSPASYGNRLFTPPAGASTSTKSLVVSANRTQLLAGVFVAAAGVENHRLTAVSKIGSPLLQTVSTSDVSIQATITSSASVAGPA
jgi:hypothetical protein